MFSDGDDDDGDDDDDDDFFVSLTSLRRYTYEAPVAH
jgi:hypothetical protein